MWQFKDNVPQSNQNLKNTIEKQTSFKTSPNLNASVLKIKQVLSETNLSFDVPCYLL